MWILQKKLQIDGVVEFAYYSETSQAEANRDLSAAKSFETAEQAREFITTQALKGWEPIQYKDPGASALQPWELEK
jgi:hypothetical protein